MDASTYLRRKREAMPQIIARNSSMDAGMRTEMLGRAVNSTFISKNSVNGVVTDCCQALPSYGSANTQPIKAPETCANICGSMNERYTAPYIEVQGFPIQYMSTSYILQPKVMPFQEVPGLASQKIAAVLCSRKY